MSALTQEELNQKSCRCGKSDCVLFLTPKCHPGAGVDAAYNQTNGELAIRCHECERHIVTVQVAEGVLGDA